jgi:hypothetical protein
MSIETELLAIKGKNELLTAEEVVAWASKHPKSKLYGQFEWDNSKAAAEYRLWQARRVIALNITYPDGNRRFVSLSLDRSNENGGYRDIKDVLQSKSLHEIMLADALRELERIRLHYEMLNQLKPVWSAVERVRKRRKGVEERRAAGVA